MDSNHVIFLIISSVLTAALHSSSVPHVSATIYCSHNKGSNYEICKNVDTQVYKYVSIQRSFHQEAEPRWAVRA